MELLMGNSFSFQLDTDPKHSTNAVKVYLDRKTWTGLPRT